MFIGYEVRTRSTPPPVHATTAKETRAKIKYDFLVAFVHARPKRSCWRNKTQISYTNNRCNRTTVSSPANATTIVLPRQQRDSCRFGKALRSRPVTKKSASTRKHRADRPTRWPNKTKRLLFEEGPETGPNKPGGFFSRRAPRWSK